MWLCCSSESRQSLRHGGLQTPSECGTQHQPLPPTAEREHLADVPASLEKQVISGSSQQIHASFCGPGHSPSRAVATAAKRPRGVIASLKTSDQYQPFQRPRGSRGRIHSSPAFGHHSDPPHWLTQVACRWLQCPALSAGAGVSTTARHSMSTAHCASGAEQPPAEITHLPFHLDPALFAPTTPGMAEEPCSGQSPTAHLHQPCWWSCPAGTATAPPRLPCTSFSMLPGPCLHAHAHVPTPLSACAHLG